MPLRRILPGLLLAGIAQAQAQEAPDDPYFGILTGAQAEPARRTAGSTERALPRPRAPLVAPQDSALPPELRAGAAARPRPVSAYVEARTGWDGVRGEADDDGYLLGVTAGFDGTVARLAGGRLFAGLLGSIDLSNARRTPASVDRDESGALPVLTLTETETTETRDVELGARVGWRGDRFGVYAMAALSSRKRERQETVSTFTEDAPGDGEADAQFTRTARTPAPAEGLFDDGLRLGAGVEAQLTRRSYVHVGYRWADYDAAGEKHQVVTGLGARF